MAYEGDSPIMNYGGDDYTRVFCKTGTQLDFLRFGIFLVVLFVLYTFLFEGKKESEESEEFYVSLDDGPVRESAQFVEVMRGGMSGTGYAEPYFTSTPTQSIYAGSSGYGRNY